MTPQLNPQSAIRNPQLGVPHSEFRIPDSKALHRFACFTALCTFFLIIAGGLVTSNDAGLAVPDWPLSFGKWMPEMTGGVLYEHGHRIVAAFVGILTVTLAIWISLREPRRWVQWLGWAALATIIAQALLGGITVLYFLPPAVSMAHASLAQAFFCITVALAVVTGNRWINEPVESETTDRPSLRVPSLFLVASIYLQLILGAGYRHNELGVAPHVVLAMIVLTLAARLCVSVARYYTSHWSRSTNLLLGLVIGQTVLGTVTFFIKEANVRSPQPMQQFIWTSTAHVALGALILATALTFALRVQRRYRKSNLQGRSSKLEEELQLSSTG